MLARRTMRSLAVVLGVCHTATVAFTLGRAPVRPATHAGGAVGDRLAMGVPNAHNNQPRSGAIYNVRGGKLFQRRAVAIPEVEVEPPQTKKPQPPAVEEPKKGLLNAYLRVLDKKPMRTKIVTSGVICGIGDLMAQALVITQGAAAGAITLGKFVGSLEMQRFVIYAFLGAFWIAPIVHYWFDALERATKSPQGPPKTFAGRMFKALKMVTIDQTVGAPIVNAGMMFLFPFLAATLTDGIGMQAGKAAGSMVKNKLWGTMVTCWKIWPLANLINFAFVPAPLRVLFMNFVGLGWNIYLAGAVN